MEKDFNYGVLPVVIEDTDYVRGVNSPIIYKVRLPSGNYFPYLCTRERQSPPETMGCTGFSANHANDTTINAIINIAIIDEVFPQFVIDWFTKVGFIDYLGSFNSSDRYTNIMAGTTRQGNRQQTVLDSIRKVGLIPEKMLPFGGNTWEEYMNPKLITQEMKDVGKKFLEYVNIAYEWIFTKGDGANVVEKLKKHLKHAPVQVTLPVCSGWDNETIVKSCSLDIPQHAVLTINVENDGIVIFDQYEQYIKKLALNYPILYGLKIVVTPIPQDLPPTKEEQIKTLSLKLIELLKQAIAWFKK